MVVVFGMLYATKYARAYFPDSIPKWRPTPVLLIWNAAWLVLFLIARATALALPQILGPVVFVGGNAVILTVFGVPGRATKSKEQSSTVEPGRERVVPEPKRRRHKRRKQ
jgi:hypothetical protein